MTFAMPSDPHLTRRVFNFLEALADDNANCDDAVDAFLLTLIDGPPRVQRIKPYVEWFHLKGTNITAQFKMYTVYFDDDACEQGYRVRFGVHTPGDKRRKPCSLVHSIQPVPKP